MVYYLKRFGALAETPNNNQKSYDHRKTLTQPQTQTNMAKETLSVELVKYCYGDRGIAGSSLVYLRKCSEEEVILREVFGGSVSSFVKIQRRKKQLTTQFTEEQSQDSEIPFQTVQIPDDDGSAINIGDGEQSYDLTTEQPTFPSSYVPILAPDETYEYLEDEAGISNTLEPGRPPSSSHTVAIFKEVEVSIPQFDYSVDCVNNDYAIDWYADDYIVAESDFNFSSVHDEDRFLLSHSNDYSPCIEPESESAVNIVSNFEIDSCSEDVFEVQPVTLDLGVIPLHEISTVPHCTNPIAGGTHEFDQQTPTVDNKGADIGSSKINRHLLNPLSNTIYCLDPAMVDISLLDQIWRMKQFFLLTFVLDTEAKNISLLVQVWQLPP
ncbi:hypothetical protein LR48_Vigan07g172700 [Vigna angularis]|uniref:Uncharacterized protein n=1 Tax=Phaseolus angularis TaxID=3914 RepID=A0A0L9UZ31_PHAAN|nr:hypothetical protein LR48_Vigan07g172700 [Vigna angularis]